MATFKSFEDIEAWRIARDRTGFVRLSQSAAQVSKMLNGLMKYLQRSTLKNPSTSSNLEL